MSVEANALEAKQPATTNDEQPVYLSAGAEHVFGILTRPTTQANGTAVLFLHAGEQNLSCHRNRLWTRLARELATQGYHCLRIDFHGSGDSSGVLVDRDALGQVQSDVRAAVEWLTGIGPRRIVIIGTCWGALVGLVAASNLPEVVRVGLVSPPLRLLFAGASADQRGQAPHERFAPALRIAASRRVLHLVLVRRDYRRWLLKRVGARLSRRLPSPQRSAATQVTTADRLHEAILGKIAARGVTAHVLFGEGDRTYQGLQDFGGLAAAGELPGSVFRVSVTPVSVHGLDSLEAQQTVADHVLEWMSLDGASEGGGGDD